MVGNTTNAYGHAMTLQHLFRRTLASTAALTFLWLAGLVYYADSVDRLQEPPINDKVSIDAIVVLTGGSERIATGIDLLQKGLGKKLFISGVADGVEMTHLQDGHALSLERRACCVVLGHQAGDTMGNAVETLAWLKRENYNSFRLVTANYHMARSLLEFRMLDKNIHIIPHPVVPPRVRLSIWWTRPGTAHLLVTEYNKLLLALVRYCLHLHP